MDGPHQHSGIEQETFVPKKGQALIWAANLLHGGSPQINPKLTRWSQVTHYYFENCVYYTPAFSDEPLGDLDLRIMVDVETEELRPNLYLGETIEFEAAHLVAAVASSAAFRRRMKATSWRTRRLRHRRLLPSKSGRRAGAA